MIKINEYQMRQLRRIGFRESEICLFTPRQAKDTIKRFYSKNSEQKRNIASALRR